VIFSCVFVLFLFVTCFWWNFNTIAASAAAAAEEDGGGEQLLLRRRLPIWAFSGHVTFGSTPANST
jgi:hypothetical protein